MEKNLKVRILMIVFDIPNSTAENAKPSRFLGHGPIVASDVCSLQDAQQ